MGIFGLAVLGGGGLTAAAVATTPAASAPQIDFSGPAGWPHLSTEELAGIGYFRRENCVSCHTGKKNGIGPDLAGTGMGGAALRESASHVSGQHHASISLFAAGGAEPRFLSVCIAGPGTESERSSRMNARGVQGIRHLSQRRLVDLGDPAFIHA